MGVSSEHEWDEDTTDENGFYSVEVSGPTWLRFYIEPLVETRLARVIVYEEGPFNSNTTLDFDLVAGHLFSGEVQSPTGDSVYLPWGADIIALTNPPPENVSFSFWTNWRDGTFEIVYPPGVYSILVRYPPRPFYPTRSTVDLRTADVENYDFILNVAPDPLPGVELPDATLITLGTPDAEGYLSVTGAPGSVTPFAAVVIAHMTSGRWTSTVAGEDGSFSATSYGPPGSTLIVKQDPSHRYYNNFLKHADPYEEDLGPISASNLDPLASTTLQIPMTNDQTPMALELGPWPLVGSGIINPYDGVAMWEVTGEISAADTLKRVVSGTLNGTFETGLYVGGIHRPKPVLADLDGNGDLDLYVGDNDGYIVHYRNDGLVARDFRSLEDFGSLTMVDLPRWAFVSDRWENMDISWRVAPAFVDIDYDGDQDLLAGTGGGDITFFRNIGTPTTPAWRFVTDEYADIDVGGYAAPAFADVDADDDYDLFIGNSDGYVVFYRNIGSREEALWMFVTNDYLGTSVSGSALPALADVDDDGDLDFFVGSNYQISHWRNDGAPTAPSWTLVTHQYANIYEPSSELAPAFADLDEDGDLDMLLGWAYGPIRTYTNLGTPSAPIWARTADDTCPLDLGGYSTPVLADWDGDGDLDLLVGDYHKRVRMLRNEGGQWDGGRWTDAGLVTAVNPDDLYHAAPTLVDIDDDGDLDLFVGEDDGTLDFLTNLGSPTNPNWVLTAIGYQGFDVGSHAKPTFGDLDGDGDYDLLMGGKYGRLHFYENTGTPTSPSWATPDHYYGGIDVEDYSAPLLTDLDGDLDPDLLIGVEDGRIWAYENDGGTFTLLTQAYGAAWPDDYATPATGDLNDDGWPDLVAGSLAGGLQVYLNRSGEPPSESLQPGDALTASGTLRVTSTGLPSNFDPTSVYLGGSFEPRPFFDADGRPHGTNNQFYSTLVTPTGFPVERYASWYNRWASYFEMTNKRMVDDHTIEADFEVTMYLPDDFPTGWYCPTLELSFGSIPGGTDETVASILTSNRARNLVLGPMVKVGEPATPHLPWMLLADTFSNATRGTLPTDDSGSLQLANRRIYQADTFFVPRSDPRSDVPFTYQLEPFMPLASVSDHSLPHQPFIPFAFPSGQLHVTVQQPDGSVQDLGTAPFSQSTSRTPVMLNGDHYEGCSGSVGDIYQLVTNSGQFDHQFDQYGLHRITMSGSIEDIWGNTYTGGGTYHVMVGREIHVHAGAIPGTPFQVGDTLAPTLRLSPAVPADVTIRLRLYRNSDPDDVLEQTITGRANRFGYFAPPSPPTLGGTEGGTPFVFDAPGEYRVDVTAVYTDTDDVVWVGSQTWGNVVETPDTRLVA
ncbi:MAG: VCBS repeat-containing protein, partial [Chloroflexi bacterium]|nr:VCBS repeat-containing protein [Chloroflexota bacterium]